MDTGPIKHPAKHHKIEVTRLTLLIILGVVLSIIGTAALAGASTLDVPGKSTPVIAYGATAQSTQPPTPTPTPALTPTLAPSPTPTPPQPISPFPVGLANEVATLEAHHRLLYHGNTSLLEVALTFDDGPNPYYTPQVLSVLKQYGVKATFFCVGSLVTTYSNLVQQEFADGQTVGDHSWSHPQLPYLSSVSIMHQLSDTMYAIQKIIRVAPIFFRPPYGAYDTKVLTQANNLALTTVMWNVDPRDWSRPGSGVIINRILNQTGRGSIILMHDGGGDRSQTVAALPYIIQDLRNLGYKFVTLPQLVADMEPAHVTPTATPSHPHQTVDFQTAPSLAASRRDQLYM